jgi:hypothetical protein
MSNTAFSAFGSTEPSHDVAGERIRWFCPWRITTIADLKRALKMVESLETQVTAGRVTVRLVTHNGLLPECIGMLSAHGFWIEAKMALGDFRQTAIIYIAKCSNERRSKHADVRQETMVMDGIIARPRKGPASYFAELNRHGHFRVQAASQQTLSNEDKALLQTMHHQTFPTFPYDFADKLELMLERPDKYRMVVARSIPGNHIYAFSNLELNTVTLDDGSRLKLAEYDNSMRVNRHTAVAGEVFGLGGVLRLSLARQAGMLDVDLCYSESRACVVAINKLSWDGGMVFAGALEKHIRISGQRDIDYLAPSRFETMNAWYYNRDGLTRLADALKAFPLN